MTDRLYYHNSFLYDFVAALEGVRKTPDGRTAVVLDRTAFYPTSGGQIFDTGWLELEPLDEERKGFLPKLRVSEVIEEESGPILHVVEGEVHSPLATNELHPKALFHFFNLATKNDTDLPGGAHMRAATGTDIESVDVDESQLVALRWGKLTQTHFACLVLRDELR